MWTIVNSLIENHQKKNLMVYNTYKKKCITKGKIIDVKYMKKNILLIGIKINLKWEQKKKITRIKRSVIIIAILIFIMGVGII